MRQTPIRRFSKIIKRLARPPRKYLGNVIEKSLYHGNTEDVILFKKEEQDDSVDDDNNTEDN